MPKRHITPLPQRPGQTLPRLWLMTDERMGEGLLPAIRRLPEGSGIVFRHYSLAGSEREALLRHVRRFAKTRRLTVIVGGTTHGRRLGAITTPVHSVTQRIAAERRGAQLLFVSPIFATRSHPSVRPLGRVRFGMLVRGAKAPVIALGGMNARRARSLRPFKIYGWAAIDALS